MTTKSDLPLDKDSPSNKDSSPDNDLPSNKDSSIDKDSTQDKDSSVDKDSSSDTEGLLALTERYTTETSLHGVGSISNPKYSYFRR